MDDALLQILINCYRTSKSLVLVMDLRWNILWSNQPHSIESLPDLLQLSPNHAANTTHTFLLDGIPQECRLLCNAQDGFRIAEIQPASQSQTVLSTHPDTLTKAVQAITSACGALSSSLEEYDMDTQDEHDYLNIIAGNCYRLYRSVFMQKEIHRLEQDQRRVACFSLQYALTSIFQQIRSILRRRVHLELECCQERLFLNGDLNELAMAVLSAAVLCTHGCTHVQKMVMTLEQIDDDLAQLTLKAEETPEELPQQDHEGNGFEGEETLLQLFCSRHEGRWLYTESSEMQSRICTMQFRTDESTGSMTLHSDDSVKEDGFFSRYRVMLSCIQYQNLY